MKKAFLLSLLIFICTFFSFAQRNKYRVYIKAEVKGRPGISYKINFQGDEVDADELERVYNSNPDPTVRVRYYNRFGIKLYDYITRFSNTPCVKETQEFTVSGSDSYIYFQLIAPALTKPVGPTSFYGGKTATFNTWGLTNTFYIWEVSRDLVNWKQADRTSSTSYDLKSDKLHTLFPGASTKYGDYYIRVKPDDDCVADRISDPTFFILRPAIPTGVPIENPCDGDAFTLTADLPGNVEWQVDEGTGSWRTFEQTTGNSVIVTLDKIAKTAPRHRFSRSIRYKSIGKSDQYTSEMATGISYYEPRPVILGYYTEPASCATSTDGKIIVVLATGGTPTVDVTAAGPIVLPNKKDWDKITPYVFENVPSGIYNIQLVNKGGGCPSDNIIVEIKIKPDLEVTDVKSAASTCIDRADGMIKVNVKNGTGLYRYILNQKQGTAWVKIQESSYSASSSYTFSNVIKGEYQVVADDNCKIKTQLVTVDYPIFTTTQTITAQYCNLANGRIDLTTISGGKAPYTLQWNKGSETGPLVSSANDGWTVASALADTYYLRITDANGCTSPALPIKIPTQKPFTYTWEIEPSGCGLAKGEARVKIENGFAPYTYIWRTMSGTILKTTNSFSDRDTLKGLVTDSYRLFVQDTKGCIVVNTFSIPERVPVIGKVISTSAVSCKDGNDGKVMIAASGGKAPYTYQWNDPLKQTTAEATQLSAGRYEVLITDAIGCTYILKVDMSYLASVYVQSFITPPTCFETCDGKINVTLSDGTPPYEMQWSTGEKNVTQLTNLCKGTYTLTVKDALACISTFSFQVKPPDRLLNPLKEDTLVLCKGQTVYLDAGAEWKNYYWKNGYNVISNERYLKINQASTYSLEVRNEQGCQALDTIRIFTSDQLLKARVAIHTPVVVGDTLLLTELSNPAPDSCRWAYSSWDVEKIRDFAPPCDQVIKFNKPGNYQVTFTAYLGECRDSLTRTITVLSSANALTQLGVTGNKTAIKKVSLYPNPNHGIFMMDVELDQESDVHLSIYGLQVGDKLLEFFSFQSSLHHQVPITLQTLPPGIYVVVVQASNQGTQLVKFAVE